MADYVGGVIAMITLELAFIAVLIWLRQRCYPLQETTRAFTEQSGSSILGTPRGDRLLLAYRLCSFLYFLCVAWAWNWSKASDGKGASQKYNYFTNWNLVLITVYFFNAASCSALRLLDIQLSARHQMVAEQLCKNTARLFDVCGSCALFVTVVSYGILDHSGDQWNIIAHITNSLFMLVEAALNDMRGSMESFKFLLAWAYFYLIFTWGLVGTQVKSSPYFFLETSSAAAFGWYSGLLVLLYVFFVAWIGVLALKHRVARGLGFGDSCRAETQKQEQEGAGAMVEMGGCV